MSIALIAMLVIMCNVYVISDDCVHARSTRQSTFQTKKLSLPKRKCSNFEIAGLLAHSDPDAARLGGNAASEQRAGSAHQAARNAGSEQQAARSSDIQRATLVRPLQGLQGGSRQFRM